MDRCSRAWLVPLVVCALAATGRTVVGQQPSADLIARLDIVGLQQAGDRYVRDVIRVRPGDPVDTKALDDAVTRLLRTGRFAGATYAVEHTDAGTVVTFRLRERTVVTKIRFEGNEHFRDAELEKQLLQKPDAPVDLGAVRDGVDALISFYHEAGFNQVAVSFDDKLLDSTGELVYRIKEGTRVRIRKIEFTGNTAFASRRLRRKVETKTAWWIFRTGAFDADKASADALAVQNFYRDEGYLDAKVRYDTKLDDTGRDMTVTFVVDEGARYRVEAVNFLGHGVFSVEELRAMITTAPDEVVKRKVVADDAHAIQDHYGELGYIYAVVRPVRVFSNEPKLVRVTFEIQEGEQYHVGRVVVRGNARTRDKVVRRALNLYPPDDLFNLTEARAAENRLRDTRIFSSARVYPVGDAPGVRDVVMDVEESAKAGDFLFGFGVTSNSGLVGSVVLDLANFDITDTPRSWKELVKMRSFFGGGQRFRLEAQPGTNLQRYRIDFTEPYFTDRPIRFDTSLYLFERSRDAWREGRRGMTASWGKRFSRGLFAGWSGEISFRLESVNIDGLDPLTASEITTDKGANLLAGVKGSLVRDRTDNRYVPSTGDRLRVSYEQVGGDHTFGKFVASYNWYTTLWTDALNRKGVLRFRGEGGAIVGEPPVFERFYAGGTGSVRGFDFRGIGEYEGLRHDNVGGDTLMLLSAEYSYPLFGENVRGHVFMDSGTAGSGAYRVAVGTGIRLTINLIGPLPLEFNIAAPITSEEDDDKQVFSFLIGSLF